MVTWDDVLERIVRFDDANWNEADHPRDEDGKFASSGGGAFNAGIPKIAASQGKPYEHLHAAATNPEKEPMDRVADIEKLIVQFQNKYQGGYLKSIKAYGDNLANYMETGKWAGKKKVEQKENPKPKSAEEKSLENFKLNEKPAPVAANGSTLGNKEKAAFDLVEAVPEGSMKKALLGGYDEIAKAVEQANNGNTTLLKSLHPFIEANDDKSPLGMGITALNDYLASAKETLGSAKPAPKAPEPAAPAEKHHTEETIKGYTKSVGKEAKQHLHSMQTMSGGPPIAAIKAQKLMDEIDAALSEPTKEATIEALSKINAVDSHLGSTSVVNTNKFMGLVKADYGLPVSGPAKPNPYLEPAKFKDLPDSTQASAAEVTKSLGMMQNEGNKKAVSDQLEKITAALGKESMPAQTAALEALPPVNGEAHSQGIQNVNKYLAELKADFGIKDAPKAATAAPKKAEIKSHIIEPKHKSKAHTKYSEMFKTAWKAEDGITNSIVPSAKAADWHAKVPAHAITAFRTYTGSSYTTMNNALRNNTELSPEMQAHVTAIDDTFEDDEFASAQKDLVVYRGEDVPANIVAGWEKALQTTGIARYGKSGIISCRSTPHGFASSSNVQYEILVPKGHKIVNAKPISLHESENELIMRHGQNFQIISIEDIGYNKKKVRMAAI